MWNEIGAIGIGVGLLDEFNKQIKSARIETEIKTGKWENIGVIKNVRAFENECKYKWYIPI